MSNEQNANVEHIFILDFGSQYSQLLAQRVRDNQTYCAIVPSSISASEIKARNPIGLILSGSSSSVGDADAPQVDLRSLSSAFRFSAPATVSGG